MASESYTLLVVPHAKARFRQFSVSVKFLRWCAGTVAVLSVILLAVFIHYFRLRVDARELTRLKSENSALRTRTAEYEANTGRLNAKLQQLEKLVTKLGVMAGVEQPIADDKLGGVGGVSSRDAESPLTETRLDAASMQMMDKTLSKLTERGTQLEAFYRDQKVLLASTPSVWPVHGYLSAGFGNRIDPFTGLKDFHPGIDISTPQGTKVMVPADGTVISCGEKGGYGNAIVVDHGYDVVTRYAHLSAYNVKPGQRVHRGDVIGFVGSTGRSTAPHLHYEVWVRDQAQNPIHFILDEYRSFG